MCQSVVESFLVLEWGTGYFVGLRNLHGSSVFHSGGKRVCKQLSLESIFLKKDLLIFSLQSSKDSKLGRKSILK